MITTILIKIDDSRVNTRDVAVPDKINNDWLQEKVELAGKLITEGTLFAVVGATIVHEKVITETHKTTRTTSMGWVREI